MAKPEFSMLESISTKELFMVIQNSLVNHALYQAL